jgi:hypothetical protein
VVMRTPFLTFGCNLFDVGWKFNPYFCVIALCNSIRYIWAGGQQWYISLELCMTNLELYIWSQPLLDKAMTSRAQTSDLHLGHSINHCGFLKETWLQQCLQLPMHNWLFSYVIYFVCSFKKPWAMKLRLSSVNLQAAIFNIWR